MSKSRASITNNSFLTEFHSIYFKLRCIVIDSGNNIRNVLFRGKTRPLHINIGVKENITVKTCICQMIFASDICRLIIAKAVKNSHPRTLSYKKQTHILLSIKC